MLFVLKVGNLFFDLTILVIVFAEYLILYTLVLIQPISDRLQSNLTLDRFYC